MAYRQSELDRRNLAAFAGDHTRASLRSISLTSGAIRGVTGLRIHFSYPLSAISGRNGSGKSTVLALAACAFHSATNGWRLPGRSLPYYRFSDFFFQTHDEVPVDGVVIQYGIHYDKWKPTESMPDGHGLGHQERRKSKGGKWNDYAARVRRPVAYFGIDRVVPPSERPIKNQRRYLRTAAQKSVVDEAARKSVGKILGIPYEDFERRGYGAYKLPIVKLQGNHYSGFNMGAGESALFGLFSAIHSAPRASLFVIDELELGLHEAAQKQLVEELKVLALNSAHQFIFTTHSPAVLGALPPEGRFFLDKGRSGTLVTPGISPAFAAGRMADSARPELVIYVEDERARTLVGKVLRHEARRRVKIVEVGSHSAVVAQLAARFIDGAGADCEVIGILDGDQRAALVSHKGTFLGRIDQRKKDPASVWFDKRIAFLPTDMPPERFVVSKIREDHVQAFSDRFQIETLGEAERFLDKAIVRGDHDEIYWLSEDLAFPAQQVWSDMCSIMAVESAEYFHAMNEKIADLLL